MEEEELEQVADTAARLQNKVRERQRQEAVRDAISDEEQAPRVDSGYVAGVRENSSPQLRTHELVVGYRDTELTVPFNEDHLENSSSRINGLLRLNGFRGTDIADFTGKDVTVFDGQKVATPKSGKLTDRLRHRWLRVLSRLGIVREPSAVRSRYSLWYGSILETVMVYLLWSFLCVLIGITFGTTLLLVDTVASAGGVATTLTTVVLSICLATLFSYQMFSVVADILYESDAVEQAVRRPVEWCKSRVQRLNRRL